MPARKMSQSKEIRELFYKKIKEKVQREKDRLKGKVEEELPSWAAWIFKPMVGLLHDIQNGKNNSRGEDGEASAFLNLWLFLSKEWVLLNDVVLEPEPDEFTQIDHVLIGPPGVFLIETKAWDGAFTGYKDNWKRKQGSGWVRCSSPTKQNKRHADLFIKWLGKKFSNELPAEAEQWINPLVVFTRAKWLKVDQCSMPVFDGAFSLAWYIRRKTKESCLSSEQINLIAEAVANAGPYTEQGPLIVGDKAETEREVLLKGTFEKSVSEINSAEIIEDKNKGVVAEEVVSEEVLVETKGRQPIENIDLKKNADIKYEKRKTKDGRSYVRVYGSREEAQKGRKHKKCGKRLKRVKEKLVH